MNSTRKTAVAVLSLLGVACFALATFGIRDDAALPVAASQLGLATDHARLAAPIAAQMPTFFVSNAQGQDNTKANVRLWDWVKLANNGEHLPNYAQETGDCVSFGAKNAAEYFTYAAVGKGTLNGDVKLIFPPHIYGGSRVTVGKKQLGRSAGSVGAWAAQWVADYGVLARDVSGVPEYSGKLADKWGWEGVPKQFVDASREFTFSTVAPVRDAADARDAICNGYPVTIASDFGTKTIRVKDGRRVAVRNARWPHQMCLVGYDGSASEPYFYVLNSWGETAHPAPLQGEPPGGFWITQSDCEYIVRQGDSFAYSGFEGFPSNDFRPDFRVLGANAAPLAARVDVMQDEPLFPLDVSLQVPLFLAGAVLLIAAVLVSLGKRRGNGSGFMIHAGIVACAMLTVAAPARAELPNFFYLEMPSSSDTATSSTNAAAKTPVSASADRLPNFVTLTCPQLTAAPADVDRCPCGCDGIGCKCVTQTPAANAIATKPRKTLTVYTMDRCPPCEQLARETAKPEAAASGIEFRWTKEAPTDFAHNLRPIIYDPEKRTYIVGYRPLQEIIDWTKQPRTK